MTTGKIQVRAVPPCTTATLYSCYPARPQPCMTTTLQDHYPAWPLPCMTATMWDFDNTVSGERKCYSWCRQLISVYRPSGLHVSQVFRNQSGFPHTQGYTLVKRLLPPEVQKWEPSLGFLARSHSEHLHDFHTQFFVLPCLAFIKTSGVWAC